MSRLFAAQYSHRTRLFLAMTEPTRMKNKIHDGRYFVNFIPRARLRGVFRGTTPSSRVYRLPYPPEVKVSFSAQRKYPQSETESEREGETHKLIPVAGGLNGSGEKRNGSRKKEASRKFFPQSVDETEAARRFERYAAGTQSVRSPTSHRGANPHDASPSGPVKHDSNLLAQQRLRRF